LNKLVAFALGFGALKDDANGLVLITVAGLKAGPRGFGAMADGNGALTFDRRDENVMFFAAPTFRLSGSRASFFSERGLRGGRGAGMPI
jgi:hypothetical protein